jgi:hypothetical protein
MALIKIDSITNGRRDSECFVVFIDAEGISHELAVERDFLVSVDNVDYLPLAVAATTSEHLLVQFPHEALNGGRRAWVTKASTTIPEEATSRYCRRRS